MSVLIVNNETYVKIASTLLNSRDWSLKRIADSMPSNKLIEKLEELRKANYDSYNTAYKENVEYFPIKYNQVMPMNLFQLLKSCECIKYQIETKDFDYSFIDELIHIVQGVIIRDMPQYDAAVWG